MRVMAYKLKIYFSRGLIIMAIAGLMLPGCSQQLDLLKIVGKSFSYEVRHSVKPPAAKLKIFPPDNPGIHAGWVGHSTVLLSFYGTQILFDPNFSSRIKIARRAVELPIQPEEIMDLDLILITHAHYDHFDLESLKRLPRQAQLIVPRGCKPLAEKSGFASVTEIDWNQSIEVRGVRIEAIRPAHWGRRSPWDGEGWGYNSYLLSKNGRTILFAGDTGYTKIFGEKRQSQKLFLAFFPISAYKPDWFQVNHCTPEQALQMFQESGAEYMIPIHWGTFIISHEPLDEPLERLKAEVKRLGIEDRVIILQQGESFTVPE